MVCEWCCDTRLVHGRPCPDCAGMTVVEHVGLVYARAKDRAYAERFLQLKVDAAFVSVDEANRLRQGLGLYEQMRLF